MHDPGSLTMIWGLTEGGEKVGLGAGGTREKKHNNCNSTNNF